MTQGIRILLVDDHSLFRESLKRLLEAEAGFRVMGSCASIVEALRVLEREPADIVLLDFDLGEEQGSGFLENAAKMGFAGRVLMVTAGMSDTEIVEALDSGVSGIFVKHSPPAQLVEAIYRALSGEIWLDKITVRSLIEGAAKKGKGQSISQALSEREHAVLVALFEGLRNKEIAIKLRVSENAVKWVRSSSLKRPETALEASSFVSLLKGIGLTSGQKIEAFYQHALTPLARAWVWSNIQESCPARAALHSAQGQMFRKWSNE